MSDINTFEILAEAEIESSMPITVELLERWGGVPTYARKSVSFENEWSRVSLGKPADGWVLHLNTQFGLQLIRRGITSSSDLRKLLELLGCKLKGSLPCQ